MRVVFNIGFFIHLLLLQYFIKGVLLYEIVMNDFDDKSLDKLIVDTIRNKILTSEINLTFKDGTYKIPTTGQNHFYLHNSLIFNSKNETILDFRFKQQSQFYIHFIAGAVDKKLIFNNITFTNYENFGNDNNNLMVFDSEDGNDSYTVEFNNCIFMNNKGIANNIKVSCTKSTKKTPQFIYNNCIFK